MVHKVRANASKHKAMSYGRMEKSVAELEAEVQRPLSEAEAMDASEDSRYGKGRRGDEVAEELRFKQSRLAKIKEAKEALEQEVFEHFPEQQAAYEKKKRDCDSRPGNRRGRPPKAPSDKPESKARRNFTDPDSRIMKMSAPKSLEQCYNGQAAVDGHHQVIAVPGVTEYANDKRQVKPAIEKLKSNLENATPKQVSATSDYYSQKTSPILLGSKSTLMWPLAD